MRVLIVTAVQAEADAVEGLQNTHVVVSGIGRTNAAVATTTALIEEGPFDAVISAGVAGILPDAPLVVGDVMLASVCIYAEEGIETPEGFRDMASIGFPMGDFPGNSISVDPTLLAGAATGYPTGPIATVATCSGTDTLAREIVRRTGALSEAMEGAAVVHAALHRGVPGLEVRAMSNTTGTRDLQEWDLELALERLKAAMASIRSRLPGG